MTQIKVDDMTCNHCVMTIQKAIRSVDADAKVDVDLATKRVSVESGLAPAEIARLVREAGYHPEIEPA